jgi:hypothetical protein
LSSGGICRGLTYASWIGVDLGRRPGSWTAGRARAGGRSGRAGGPAWPARAAGGGVLSSTKSRPSPAAGRQLLYGWSFNVRERAGPPDKHLIRAESWIAANTRPVRELADPAVLRPALDSLALRLDGKPGAAATVSRRRAILDNAVEYAVELGHLSGNSISSTKWRAPKTTEAVNPRVVINHGQARALLAAVGKQESGRALVAFFGGHVLRGPSAQ